MSIADHFERAPDPGFIRDYDSSAARRQLNMSVALVAVIAVAAVALGFLVRFDNPSQAPSFASSPAAPPAYAGHL